MSGELTTKHVAFQHDLEVSGSVNRAAGQGAKFALLLSMLEQDVLGRPRIQVEEDTPPATQLEGLSCYREPPLKAEPADIDNIVVTSKLLRSSGKDALLWQCMHPHPLSQHNDAKRLADEVIVNCDYYTQRRLAPQPAPDKEVDVDETLLYDVLENLSELNF